LGDELEESGRLRAQSEINRSIPEKKTSAIAGRVAANRVEESA
jgi:hypothetical protein